MPVSDSVLKKLNDMSPMQRRATLDALNAILGSRQGAKQPGNEIAQDTNVEIDPELDQTQNKSEIDGSSVDLDDPEHLMDQKNEKESEDDSSEDADQSDNGTDNESDDESNESDDDTQSENDSSSDDKSSSNANNKNQTAPDQDDDTTGKTNNSNAYDKSEKSSEKDNNSDESSGGSDNADDKDSQEDSSSDGSEDEDSGSDVDYFDTDTADKTQQQQNTHDINRTINEGEAVTRAKKQAMQNGDKSISQSAIDDLEKSINDLKQNKEEYSKLSKEDLADVLNKVIDKIDALNPLYKSDKSLNDREISMEREFDNGTIIKDVEKEERGNKQKDIIAQKAREREANKYTNFNSIQDFEIDLYDTVRDQVEMVKKRNDTYSRINSRYEQEPVIMPGSVEELEESPEKPKIQVYFDQSGSWGPEDIQVGSRALKVLQEMEERGEITVEIFYFSNHICTSADDASLGGGTYAWNEIINNIKASNATNVVLMTDSDMDYQARNSAGVTVPGTVWIIWRNGDHSDDIARKIRGEGGTYQYSFRSNY